jgi:hypothetical protein
LAIQDPALKARGENIAEHHERFFVTTRRESVETSVGVRDADVLGLSSVKSVAQNPAAVAAMGVHAASAEIALQTGSDARDDDPVSDMKFSDTGSDLLDYSDPFVAENAALGDGREISLEDMEIGAANCGGGDPNDGIARFVDRGARLVFPRTLAGAVVNERFHGLAGNQNLDTCRR